MLVVGHLAVNRTLGQNGVWNKYYGGAGYHVVAGASMVIPGRVELISNCGVDFPVDRLLGWGVGMEGVEVENEVSDKFVIKEKVGRKRTFRPEGLIWSRVRVGDRKIEVAKIGWVHLATASPQQQLQWLKELKQMGFAGSVSADSFELFVKQDPEAVVEVFRQCEMVFVNEYEWKGIEKYLQGWVPKEMILKLGARGGEYYQNGKKKFRVGPILSERVVDTTGAGELVAGVYLGSRIKGINKVKSLTEACRVASKKVEQFDVLHIRDQKS